jgi:glycosyltransferase involved in cell wall biosynthesis|tara:strand:- start:95 stop:922 length:828 start_codon:yes stop_codon:yes gene_type:complete
MKYINSKIDNFKFTIITSTYNCGNDILVTAESIRNQNRNDIQWIVVDGSSSTENKILLEECKDLFSVFISEKDTGIYDAWNKGCDFIKGSWVIFLGAGDMFYSANTLNLIEIEIDKLQNQTKLIYGKLELISETGKQLKIIGENWDKMRNKWNNGRMKLPVHPEVFHHKSLFEDLRFNTEYTIVGDSDFLIKAIAKSDPIFVDVIVTKMLAGGTSQNPKNREKIINEIKLLNKNNNMVVPTKIWYLFKLRLLFKKILGKTLGYKNYNVIRESFKI